MDEKEMDEERIEEIRTKVHALLDRLGGEELDAEELWAKWDSGAGPVYVSFTTGALISEEAYADDLAQMVRTAEQGHAPFSKPFDPRYPVAHTSGVRDAFYYYVNFDGLTNRAMAKFMGMNESTLNKYIYGNRKMPLHVFAHLVDARAIMLVSTGRASSLTTARLSFAYALLGLTELREKARAEFRARKAKCLYLATKAATMPPDQLQTLLSVAAMADGEEGVPEHVLPATADPTDASLTLLFKDTPPWNTRVEQLGAITRAEFLERVEAALSDGDAEGMQELLDSLLFTMENSPSVK